MQNTGYEKQQKNNHTKNRKTKRVIATILATLTGASAVAVASAVIAYDSFFDRYERPDYDIIAGEYCYERIKDRLDREQVSFKSGTNDLKGYYYKSEQGKGLIVIVHGFHAGADDFLPMTEYFVGAGYNVFCYDATGVYDSGGESCVGMCQSLVDLDNAIKFLTSTAPYKDQKLFLIGHSWGGYAVSSVLSIHGDKIESVGAIAPMNNGSTIMVEKGEQYAGKIAKISKPVFDIYQKLLFNKYVEYNGVKGINSVDIPVLVAQGIDDKVITYDAQSIIAHRDEITNPNVIYYETKGLLGDHVNLWHSLESVVYQKEVESDIKRLQLLKGEKLTRKEKAEYMKTVNHSLYSAVNTDLLGKIVEMFDGRL